LFKQRSQKANAQETLSKDANQSEKANDQFIKQLEIIPDDVIGKDEQLKKYTRLAMVRCF
jgi:protein-disulfide isomerase